MIDLNTVVPPHPDLLLTFAVAINDRGEIAGFGVPPGCAPQDYGLCGHAYVLIPCRTGEKCENVSSGKTSAALAIQPNFGAALAAPQTKPATPLDKARMRLQQRMHLPGRRAAPSD
jgi:hypothetical protein